jgi:hypothetical protein
MNSSSTRPASSIAASSVGPPSCKIVRTPWSRRRRSSPATRSSVRPSGPGTRSIVTAAPASGGLPSAPASTTILDAGSANSGTSTGSSSERDAVTAIGWSARPRSTRRCLRASSLTSGP